MHFRIYWWVLDGAECNRQLIKMNLKNKDVIEEKFVICNIHWFFLWIQRSAFMHLRPVLYVEFSSHEMQLNVTEILCIK